jgi:RHS repeat-associated protein
LTQSIEYNIRNKTSTITEGDYNTLQFLYGHDNQRRMTSFYNENGLALEKYFVGLYEKEVQGNSVRHINYIMAGDGITAIVIEEEENGNSTPPETYYTYKDHLGSIVALTDVNGDVVLEQSFDAWGRYRNPNDWTYNNINESPTWLRGYTGHEHLPHFDLINMNGRIYDPTLGRMLSPDKYIQDPLFSQSYNRFTYAWNNPLRYTDPSGESVLGIVIASTIIAGNMYLGGVKANKGEWNPFKWEADMNTFFGVYHGMLQGVTFVALGKFAAALPIASSVLSKTIAVTSAGILNALYQHDSYRGFGWHTVGHFAAGAAGAHFGIDAGLHFGLLAGGMFNVIVNFQNDENAWEVAQSFVGGGLQAFNGVALHGKLVTDKAQYIKFGGKYALGKTAIGKAASKALIYTVADHASAFAYTDKKYYLKMDGRSFLYITGGGFINGFMQGLGNNEKFLKKNFGGQYMNTAIAFRYAGLTTSMLMSVRGTTKENPFDYYKLGSKVNISNFKFLLYNLQIEE